MQNSNASRDNSPRNDEHNGLKKPIINPNPTPRGTSSKRPLAISTKGKTLSKMGGIYSSTPNLQQNIKIDRNSINHISPLKKSINFGLTKKYQQAIIPSKAMTLELAEKLMQDAHNKIDEFKEQQNKGGNIDENLEFSIKENKYLQKTLISMQDIINKLFEKFDPVKAPLKSYPQTQRIKSPPKSSQMKYRTKEVENAQHALDNMMVEYDRLSQRMEMIKDPNYFSNLHMELSNVSKEMKELELHNKTLQTEQKKREIELEKLIAQGAPDTMFQINDLQKKVTITKDQLRREQIESEEIDKLTNDVIEQEKQLKEKEVKLRTIGSKYEVNFDTSNDESKRQLKDVLESKKETYKKHLDIAEGATKVIRKKLKTTSKVNKNKLKELEKQKAEYEAELEKITLEVKDKNIEISELMEKNAEFQKVRGSNHFLGENKNGNGYDAVQKAIQEQDEKETNAITIIQSWCRMILAKILVHRLNKQRNEAMKEIVNKPNINHTPISHDISVGEENKGVVKAL
jgi:hypothetical protein